MSRCQTDESHFLSLAPLHVPFVQLVPVDVEDDREEQEEQQENKKENKEQREEEEAWLFLKADMLIFNLFRHDPDRLRERRREREKRKERERKRRVGANIYKKEFNDAITMENNLPYFSISSCKKCFLLN
jgi:hypothetical protein